VPDDFHLADFGFCNKRAIRRPGRFARSTFSLRAEKQGLAVKAMAIRYTITPNNEVIYTQTVLLARFRTAEEAEQLVSLLNSGIQRMVDDWLAQNDGPIPIDVWERIQREWRARID